MSGYELTTLYLKKQIPDLLIRKAQNQPSYFGEDPKCLVISSTSEMAMKVKIKNKIISQIPI